MASDIALFRKLWKYHGKKQCRKSHTSAAANCASSLLESQFYVNLG
jgi:hypothetical protein